MTNSLRNQMRLDSAARASVAVLAAALLCTGVHAGDCEPYWLPTFGDAFKSDSPDSPQVGALAFFDDGTGDGPALYAGGRFPIVGGVIANNIARWNGTSWSAVGGGMNDWVNALTVFNDGTGDGPALYAGGVFTMAGGVLATRGIAKWNGTSWSTVGGGTDGGRVNAVTVFDDGTGSGPALYAGGDFTMAGGVLANRIAKWNGTSWSALGSGLNDDVKALTVFDDGTGGGPALYAGGRFLMSGGVIIRRIARWNGTSWSALGSGMDDRVDAFTVFDDGSGGGPALFAGGAFATAGRVLVNQIAKWNGTSWSAVGSGIDGGGVRALTVFDDGTGGGPALYVGGNFNYVGRGQHVNYIARWNGTSWSALGIGVNGLVLAMTVFEDGSGGGPALYAGGSFAVSPAGDSYLARWQGCVPPGQYVGPDGGSWFTPAHWAGGMVPTASTDVFVRADVVIDQPGAQADDVVVIGGSALTIAGGALQAHSITVNAGSTLALVGEASLLQTVDLEIQPSAELQWSGGTIRILGGTLALPPGDLIVGDSPVLSRLELLDGASCSVNGHFYVGMDAADEGEVLLADGSNLSVSGNTTIGFHGSGSMTVESGSLLTCGSGTTISLHPASIGTMIIIDPGSRWVSTGDIEVSGIDGDGLLQIAGGARVTSSRGWIARSPESVGVVSITGLDSKWTCSDQFFVGGWPFGAGGDAVVTVGSAATLRVLGAELRVWPQGEIRGSGFVDAGSVLCSGLLKPGSAIGSLTCGGNVTLDSNGELSVELAGAGAGQFDRLLIGGTALLAGQLTIASLTPFVPQPGQSFGVLNASQINGGFDFIDGVGPACGGYVVAYTSSLVTVSVDQGADLNCDGVINTLDLGILLAFWGPVGLFPAADINDDGTINTLDLGILLGHWTL